MKFCKSLVVFLSVAITYRSGATIHTVSRDKDVGGIPAQFTEIQEAIDDASVQDGDTIYVHPSEFQYNSFDLTKKLVIVGIGHYNLSQNESDLATIMQFFVKPGGSGSTFIGLVIGSVYNHLDQSDLKIIRCRIHDLNYEVGGIARNWYLEGSVFSGFIGGNSSRAGSNILIRNCVFGVNGARGGQMYKVHDENIVIENCVFLGSYASPSNLVHTSSDYVLDVTYINNVFFGRQISSSNQAFEQNTLISNIFYSSLISSDDDFEESNILKDNIYLSASNPPQFENYIADQWFDYDFDLKLSDSDPNASSGVNGQRPGLLDSFNKYGTPFNPQIFQLMVLTPTVTQDGSLDFFVEGASAVQEQ